MSSATHVSLMSSPLRGRAPSTSPLPPNSTSSASIALTIGARHSHTPTATQPHSSSSRISPAPLYQPHQQPLILLRPHPSLPHSTPSSAAAVASSLSSSSSSLDPSAALSSAAGVPFFVAASVSSSASGASLSTSAHSAFSFPAASAPPSSAAGPSAFSAPSASSPLLSSPGAASGGAVSKRISFCSVSPAAPSSTPSSSRSLVSFDDWHRLLASSVCRVDKRAVSAVVLRWLVQEGYADVADCFEAEALLKADRPSAHIEERTAIRKLILGGDVAAAVSRCNALYPAMLDQPQHAALAFMAQQQTLIELIREQQMDQALAFARQEMAPRAQHHPALMLELEKTMSLLAFPQPATQSPYGTLLSQQRRHAVSSAFNAALLQQQQQIVQPHSSATVSQLSSLQPAVSDLVRLMQRLQCLQPQLACTHSYPTLGVICKLSAAITATASTTGAGLDSGAASGAPSAAAQRSNSVASASVLSPVASRTPVTMPMPSRSVARHQLPSPFLLSSSVQPSVPPSPVSLSASLPGPLPASSGSMSPSLTAIPQLSSAASTSSSRRSSINTPSPFSLTSPLPSHVARIAAYSSAASGSGGGGGGGRGGSSVSGSSSSTQSTRRGSAHNPPRSDDDDMVT